MAGDAGDRTESPTPRRREEARQRGQVARSTDLNAAVLLIGGLLCLSWFGPKVLDVLMAFMREHLAPEDSIAALDPGSLARSSGWALVAAVGPIMGGLLVVALLASWLQVGFLFTTHPITPSLTRLNPLNGVGRLFSARSLVQLAMSFFKLLIVGFVTYRAVVNRSDRIFLALETSGLQQMALMTGLVYDVCLRLGLALLVLALMDYLYQRWRHERDLRMTKEEVKEEMRRMEGDPIMKQRRRKMQMAAIVQQIRTRVPKADVVVTNPTELAIAIQYDSKTMRAPIVIAKGQDFLAQKIREVAAQHRIPIIERKPLAQALYKTVEVGQEVPEKFYQAIAEILAYVYELSGKAPPRAAAA